MNSSVFLQWYKRDPIEKFIDENKALIRRMYGEFQTPAPTSGGSSANENRRSVRQAPEDDKPWLFRDAELFQEELGGDGTSFHGGGFHENGGNRTQRQANNNRSNNKDNKYHLLLD